jgi:HD-GYP domain-containing protein (c-di-GMP phosphodiesterase class II)
VVTTVPSWSPADLRVKELQGELLAVRTSVICAFNQLLDLKDLNTGVHSTRLAEWSVRIGKDLGFDEATLRDLEVASILHDIGKIGTPDHILRKPSRLTDEERDIIKKHPEYGWAVLRVVPGFERVSLFVLHHHEAFDGTGYPAGLRGDEIPIGSRIVSVMDSFDAMISSRPYRRGLSLEEAIRRLEEGIGTQFDPVVTPRFIALARADASTVFDATGASLASSL